MITSIDNDLRQAVVQKNRRRCSRFPPSPSTTLYVSVPSVSPESRRILRAVGAVGSDTMGPTLTKGRRQTPRGRPISAVDEQHLVAGRFKSESTNICPGMMDEAIVYRPGTHLCVGRSAPPRQEDGPPTEADGYLASHSAGVAAAQLSTEKSVDSRHRPLHPLC